MMNRKLTASLHDDPPILVCADLQIEYLTEGRRHVIADAEAITSRCLELLTLWRDNLWPVMHLKRIAQAAWFNPASNLTDWIAEFKPTAGRTHLRASAAVGLQFHAVRRIHVQHAKHSLRLAQAFPSMRPSCRPSSTAFIAATAIRSSAMRWPADAPAVGDAASYKAAVIKVIGNYAGVQESSDLVGAGGKIAV